MKGVSHPKLIKTKKLKTSHKNVIFFKKRIKHLFYVFLVNCYVKFAKIRTNIYVPLLEVELSPLNLELAKASLSNSVWSIPPLSSLIQAVLFSKLILNDNSIKRL